MKIAVLGRGNVGGGLGDLWEKAGHDVARIGKELPVNMASWARRSRGRATSGRATRRRAGWSSS
jgi:predicted dinucleotide-binding enzyme